MGNVIFLKIPGYGFLLRCAILYLICNVHRQKPTGADNFVYLNTKCCPGYGVDGPLDSKFCSFPNAMLRSASSALGRVRHVYAKYRALKAVIAINNDTYVTSTISEPLSVPLYFNRL